MFEKLKMYEEKGVGKVEIPGPDPENPRVYLDKTLLNSSKKRKKTKTRLKVLNLWILKIYNIYFTFYN